MTSFFSEDERRRREETREETLKAEAETRAAGRKAFDERVLEVAEELLPKALEAIRAAFIAGEEHGRFTHEFTSIHYSDWRLIEAIASQLGRLVARETKLNCKSSCTHQIDEYPSVSVNLKF